MTLLGLEMAIVDPLKVLSTTTKDWQTQVSVATRRPLMTMLNQLKILSLPNKLKHSSSWVRLYAKLQISAFLIVMVVALNSCSKTQSLRLPQLYNMPVLSPVFTITSGCLSLRQAIIKEPWHLTIVQSNKRLIRRIKTKHAAKKIYLSTIKTWALPIII